MEYVPGKTTVADLYHTEPLPVSVAAERAGVPAASVMPDGLLKILKLAGMIGCLLLGTVGMGALLLHVVPSALLHSPLALVAVGLSFILVGGAYLTVAPPSRRYGSLVASRPEEAVTGRSLRVLCPLVAGVTVVVALVDTKALMALNSARAIIDPQSVPSFALTFLVAGALSAMYVLGTAMLVVSEGIGYEAARRIEAEQQKYVEAYRKTRENSLEVGQACEALNSVDVIQGSPRSAILHFAETYPHDFAIGRNINRIIRPPRFGQFHDTYCALVII